MRKQILLWIHLLLAASPARCGDTVYALWGDWLSRFDSESPWVQEHLFPLDPRLRGNLEFDPVTRQLWSFEYPICQVTCPPPRDPAVIDPLTGDWSFVSLPGLSLGPIREMDIDIDPLARELRFFDYFGGNFSYSLDRLELRIDEPLTTPFTVAAVAHKPPVNRSGGVETYVIGYLTSETNSVPGGSGLQLARIGGPNGDPPASTGILTVVGPIDAYGERLAFDIAPDGTAYLATFWSLDPPEEENKLYRVDLGSGALDLIGMIEPPNPHDGFSGLAVAPFGQGGAIVEVPALSRGALALFALALATAAITLSRRLRTFPMTADRQCGTTHRDPPTGGWSALWLLLAWLVGSGAAGAETIYAVAITLDSTGEYRNHLIRFDSESPEILEQSTPLTGALDGYDRVTLEFDPVTSDLYAFAAFECAILCPPIPVSPARIDPFSGNSSYLAWTDFPEFEVYVSDYDIHPATHELRMAGFGDRNFRFDLDSLQSTEDTPFDEPGGYPALAHTYGGEEAETFAIVNRPQNGGVWLARIGGPDGDPPASSGEVTWIGQMTIAGSVAGFDVSPTGAGYFSTFDYVETPSGWTSLNRLYRVDLATAAVEELGLIAGGDPFPQVTGIAVPPGPLGPGILSVPGLSGLGILALALLLAAAAVSRLRAGKREGLLDRET